MAMAWSSLHLHTLSTAPRRLFSEPYSKRSYCWRVYYSLHRNSDTIDNTFSTTNVAKCCYWNVTNDYSCKWRQKNAESEYYEPLEDQDQHLLNYGSLKLLQSLKAFYAFTRPYALKGICIGIVSCSLTAIESFSDIATLPFIVGLLQNLLGFLTAHAYGTGVNQVFDVEIDKVNKPYLPLASGEMPFKVGVAIVCAFALLAFGIAIFVGSKPLFWGISIYSLAHSAYSINLPLLRWKNSAVGAIVSILIFHLSLHFAVYLHMQTFAFQKQAYFSRPMTFGVLALAIFYIVVGLYKDIPDIEGDKKYGVKSLATSIGEKQVFWICIFLMELTYASAIVFGATSSLLWSKFLTMSSHVVLASILWKKAKSVDLKNKAAISSFYMFIWKLMYAEYLLIPFVR